MLIDGIILGISICFFGYMIYRHREYGGSIIPGLISICILTVYMLFYRPRDDFFKVWAFLYGAFTSFVIAYIAYEYTWSKATSIFFISTSIVLIVCLIFSVLIIYFPPTTYRYEEVDKREEIPIYSIADDSEEIFTLGCTKINGGMAYFYYYEITDGLLAWNSIPSDKNTSKLFPVLVDGEPHIKKLWTVKQKINEQTNEVVEEEVIGGPLYYFYIPKEYKIETVNNLGQFLYNSFSKNLFVRKK